MMALWVGVSLLAALTPRPAVVRLRRLLPPQRPSPGARVVRLLRRRLIGLGDRRRAEGRWRAAVIELCDAIGAELAAGRPPEAALAAAIGAAEPSVAAALSVARTGDVSDLLELAADRPGAGGLRLLAACWRIGAERGGTFASVVDGLADALRDEEAHREEIAAQLAGPHATARLLALLPLLGLAMAAGLGARPLAFLFGSLPGAFCLLLGVGLDLAGLSWTRRIATAAEPAR